MDKIEITGTLEWAPLNWGDGQPNRHWLVQLKAVADDGETYRAAGADFEDPRWALADAMHTLQKTLRWALRDAGEEHPEWREARTTESAPTEN